MNKRHLHHIWTKFRVIKPRYLLALTILSAVICIFALRANNDHMAKLRANVYAADKSGINVQVSLQKLQAYVTRHMNTDLSTGPNAVYPPIQLEYTYQRLEQAEAEQEANTNSTLYTAAQNYCQKLDPTDFSGHNRVPCIEQYVENNGASSLPQIPVSLYKFDFVSPGWSPDLAGWSLVTTILFAVLFIVNLIATWWLKNQVAK
jgi:hypothetical protein